MNTDRLGRIVRTLRVRERHTQTTLALHAGVTRSVVSAIENGRADRLRLGAIQAVIAALGARIEMRVMWNGPELDRLLDAGHAAIGASVKRRLERWGWVVRVETSFNHFGDRGRIDLLAWHPVSRLLLVIEIKTDLVDVQALLGPLDTKVRVAPIVARGFGWDVKGVVPAIVFLEDRTIRNRLARVDALFDRFAVRGRAATSWLRRPDEAPSGLLWFTAGPRTLASRSSAPRVRVAARSDLKSARVAMQ